MIVLIFVLVLCLCVCAVSGYLFYKEDQKKKWKSSSKPLTAEQLALLSGQAVTPNVDCQNLSDTTFAWPNHQGKAEIQDWAGFVYQDCKTYPSAITTNTNLLASYYSTMGSKPPDRDPIMTESQQIDSSGKYTIENPVAQRNLIVTNMGAVKFGNTKNSTNIWASPAGQSAGSGNYTLKFDSSSYNKGNLCVFPPNSSTPTWCIQNQITVPTVSCSSTGSTQCPAGSYSGPDLASYQNSLLNSAGLKNTSDTQPRFAMIADDGSFCVYRGTPGAPSGAPVICKSQ